MVSAEPFVQSFIAFLNNKTLTSKGFNTTGKVTEIRGGKISLEKRKLEGKTFPFPLISLSFFSFAVILLSKEINSLGCIPLQPEFIL